MSGGATDDASPDEVKVFCKEGNDEEPEVASDLTEEKNDIVLTCEETPASKSSSNHYDNGPRHSSSGRSSSSSSKHQQQQHHTSHQGGSSGLSAFTDPISGSRGSASKSFAATGAPDSLPVSFAGGGAANGFGYGSAGLPFFPASYYYAAAANGLCGPMPAMLGNRFGVPLPPGVHAPFMGFPPGWTAAAAAQAANEANLNRAMLNSSTPSSAYESKGCGVRSPAVAASPASASSSGSHIASAFPGLTTPPNGSFPPGFPYPGSPNDFLTAFNNRFSPMPVFPGAGSSAYSSLASPQNIALLQHQAALAQHHQQLKQHALSSATVKQEHAAAAACRLSASSRGSMASGLSSEQFPASPAGAAAAAAAASMMPNLTFFPHSLAGPLAQIAQVQLQSNGPMAHMVTLKCQQIPSTSNGVRHYENGGQMSRKQTKKERDTHIKKPLNAFMLFMKEMRPEVMQEVGLKERQSAEINRILGRKWHKLTKEEQQKYYNMAREERAEHLAKYPGWSARDNYAINKKKKKKRDKIQGNLEMKKCRARFGIDKQNQWCKHCRRKKKCLRFKEAEAAAEGNASQQGLHMSLGLSDGSSSMQDSPPATVSSTTFESLSSLQGIAESTSTPLTNNNNNNTPLLSSSGLLAPIAMTANNGSMTSLTNKNRLSQVKKEGGSSSSSTSNSNNNHHIHPLHELHETAKSFIAESGTATGVSLFYEQGSPSSQVTSTTGHPNRRPSHSAGGHASEPRPKHSRLNGHSGAGVTSETDESDESDDDEIDSEDELAGIDPELLRDDMSPGGGLDVPRNSPSGSSSMTNSIASPTTTTMEQQESLNNKRLRGFTILPVLPSGSTATLLPADAVNGVGEHDDDDEVPVPLQLTKPKLSAHLSTGGGRSSSPAKTTPLLMAVVK